MLKSYEETFRLRVRDCDVNGVWRLSAILECMQEAAGAHSYLLGCGQDVLSKRDTAWVLSRCEIQMERYPAIGEEITVQTFPMPTRMYFFPRYYLFLDAQGHLIGKAGSLWLLLDLRTRHMLPPGDISRMIPDNRDLPVPMGLPSTVTALQGEEIVMDYTPVYTDLDVNRHVNNTRYADWLCNMMGLDRMTRFEPASVVINYNVEIRPEETVTLHRVLQGDEFRLSGILRGKSAFEIGGKFRIRS